MREPAPIAGRTALRTLMDLTQRVGSDPLLTQASTGNSSAKLDGILWIKASGRWMANATRDDIFIPLDLEVVMECLRRGIDPAERYPGASLETSMHAVLPHPVVFHVHCVNTIAWAVRSDAPLQMDCRLEGLRWQWVPYVASGLPLCRGVERALSNRPDASVFVLANHGLVVAGASAAAVEALLKEVKGRLAICPRKAHPPDYAVLSEICQDSRWDLPDDDGLHSLGTDAISQAILAGGLLYPCQAIFCGSNAPALFRAVPCSDLRDGGLGRYRDRPFLIVEGCGVVVSQSIAPVELAMISGLAQVVQRLDAAAPLRYLTEAEVAAISGHAIHHYRELASAGQSVSAEFV